MFFSSLHSSPLFTFESFFFCDPDDDHARDDSHALVGVIGLSGSWERLSFSLVEHPYIIVNLVTHTYQSVIDLASCSIPSAVFRANSKPRL